MTDEGMEPEAAPSTLGLEPETGAAPHPVPWENPEISRLSCLFRTLGQVLFHPGAFFRAMPREGWAEALAFGLITGSAGVLALLYWQLLFYQGLRTVGGMSAISRLYSLAEGATLAMMVLAPGVVLGNLAFSTLGLWAAVGLTGGPWSVFAQVWRITCYAQGAMVAGIIPILGGPAAGLWNLILYYQGLRGSLEMSSWRAIGVLFLSMLLQGLLALLLLGSLWSLRFLRD